MQGTYQVPQTFCCKEEETGYCIVDVILTTLLGIRRAMPTNKPFVASKKQLHRLTCIVSLLKRSDDVTADKIIGELRGAEQDTGISLGTGAKTVYRDMQTLREEYKCPVVYDSRRACYTLSDKQYPSRADAPQRHGNPCGHHRTSLPKSYLRRNCTRLGSWRRANHADEQHRFHGETTAWTRSKSCPRRWFRSQTSTSAVFNVLSQCRCLDMKYKDTHGKVGGRIIEPHGLVYYGTNWYILAYCREAKDRRLFNVSRILGATIEDDTFTPREDIIKSFTVDEMMIFCKMRDIVITLTAAGAKFARAHMLHPEQKLSKGDDGSYKLTAPVANEKDTVSWILQQGGEAIPQEPELLVTAVKEAVKKLSSLS